MTAPGSILRKFQKVAVITAAIVATAISPASLANAKGGHGGGGGGGGSGTHSEPHRGNGGGPTPCRDGSISPSSGSGTCSHHGGEA
jgi:hypothetical protein